MFTIFREYLEAPEWPEKLLSPKNQKEVVLNGD